MPSAGVGARLALPKKRIGLRDRLHLFPSPRPSPQGRGRIVRRLSASPRTRVAALALQKTGLRLLFPLPEGEGQGEGETTYLTQCNGVYPTDSSVTTAVAAHPQIKAKATRMIVIAISDFGFGNSF